MRPRPLPDDAPDVAEETALVLHRDRVERSLPTMLRRGLWDLCQAWGVRDPERWPDHPRLREFLALTAANTLRNRKLTSGLSRTAALHEACVELGLHPETVRSRLADATKKYLEARSTSGGESPPNEPSGWVSYWKRATLRREP